MQVVHLPVFPENPSNPARVNMQTGVLELNDQAMALLPEYAQRFVMAHERGHWHGRTYNEHKADEYALGELALKQPNSLWHFVKSVRMVSRDDPERVNAATYKALKIAAKEGSKEAQEIINDYACADGGRSHTKKEPVSNGKRAIAIALATTVLLLIIWLITKKMNKI